MSISLTIDAMPLLAGSGGVSNYVCPLIERFITLSNPAIAVTLHFRTASRVRRRHFSRFRMNRPDVYSLVRMTNTNLPDRFLKVLWRSRCNSVNELTLPRTDVYLATTEMMPLHPDIGRVAIVHDLTPALIPQFFRQKRETYLRRMNLLLRSCHAIVAVSQTTADNIANLCGIEKEKIHVIYAGLPSKSIKDSSDDRILDRLGVHRPYLLYVGALAANKNVEGAIRCFGQFIKRTRLDWKLVLTGKSFMPEGYYQAIAREEGIADRIVFTGWLDEERWALYRNAELLIHLSWYEGFPLPVLEAMAFGLPVLASNRGPFPEAIQNRELIVDPADQNQVSEKLALFAQDPAIRSRWKEHMTRRAEDFSWEKSARKLFEVLQTVSEIKGASNKPKG